MGSVLEWQLEREFALLPNKENLVRHRLEVAAGFLSNPGFADCLEACRSANGSWRLVEVSPSGACFVDSDATRARVFVIGDCFGKDTAELDGYYRYLVSLVLAKRRGALLHAAGVMGDNAAFLFVGPSGSGKTTIAHQAKEQGWAVLADDGVIIKDMGPDGFWAFRTPWNAESFPWRGDFGSGPEGGPIRSIFFIQPDKVDEIGKMSPMDGAVRLVRSAYPLIRGLQAMDSYRMFELFAELGGRVPCYTLSFAVPCRFLESIKRLEKKREGDQ
jgi:hypothetical protein